MEEFSALYGRGTWARIQVQSSTALRENAHKHLWATTKGRLNPGTAQVSSFKRPVLIDTEELVLMIEQCWYEGLLCHGLLSELLNLLP